MNIWHEFPLVRVYLAIAAGISLAIITGAEDFSGLLMPGILFISVILSGIFIRGAGFYRYRWVFGLLLNLFFILLGYDLVILHQGNLQADHFSRFQGNTKLIVIVDEPPTVKNNSCKTFLRIRAAGSKDGYHAASGRILAYFSKDSLSKQLRYGDLLIVAADPQAVEPPRNPGAFDYRRYLAANNVYHQVFLREGTWKKLAADQGPAAKMLAYQVRDKFQRIFRENGLSGKEYAVSSALILGDSDLLDAETRREYAGSGAMHILSVSGMHVAVIFAVLNLMLGFMDKRKELKILKTVILILVIWFYATLTGLSPAVLRAAWMITFVIFGLSWMRHANIYNVLAASALLITINDPFIITNAGFQLSYLAVLGIVSMEPMIYRLWSPRLWIVNWTWKVIAVSLAAQLAIFPIVFYYFHQFANYFLLTNLVAIPLSAFVIYSGIAVLITSPVHFLSALLAKVMTWLLIAMNSSVKWIEEAPGAVSRDVPFSISMMILSYLLIIFLVRLWLSRRKIYVFLTLGITLLMAMLHVTNAETGHSQKELVVYSLKKHTSFCFISGREAVLFADSAVTGDSILVGFTMRPHWISKALHKVAVVNLSNVAGSHRTTALLNGECLARDNYYQFLKNKVAFVSSRPVGKFSGTKLAVDFLIIGDIPGMHMDRLLDFYTAGQVIIDSSTPLWRSRIWQEECRKLGQKCYSVPAEGSFIADLR